MSIQHLPNELINQIVSQVDDKFVEYPGFSREASLASLARVSKRFVDPVRIRLYRRPFLGSQQIMSWDAAIRLVDGLTMNGRALGKTVRSLQGLGDWFKNLLQEELRSKLPYQARGCTPAFSWYLQVLRICPRIGLVELVFETLSELEKVLKAIGPAASTTLYAAVFVGFENPAPPWQVNLTFDLVLSALQAAELSGIDYLYLQDVSFDFMTSPSRPSMPYPFTQISVEGQPSVFLADRVRALPYDTSELADLSFTTSSTYPNSNLLPILEHLGPKLQFLTILFFAVSDCPPKLSKYRLAPQHFTFPLKPFTKFSQLNSLTLNGFVGPSTKLLSFLVTACPFLREIDFGESFWIPNEPNGAVSRTNSYFQSIFQEEEVIKEFSKFRFLKSLRLGYLPTTETGDYKKLEKAMRDRGVWCRWQTCRPEGNECDYCGEDHSDEED
ncbi:hypothetical protein JCM5350_002602 [Sporobolomyces pararoseus]